MIRLMLFGLAWLAVGSAIVLVAIKLTPATWLEATNGSLDRAQRLAYNAEASYGSDKHEYREQFRKLVMKLAQDPGYQYNAGTLAAGAICAVGWPIMLLFGVPWLAIRAATASTNKQIKSRAALEAQLAETQKEVEELLRKGVA